MLLKTEKIKDTYFIRISGELDASNAITLDQAIFNALEQNEKSIVLDCRELEYVSSAGLGVFVSYLTEFEQKGVDFSLSNVNAHVMKILSLLGLDKLLKIIDS